MKAYLVWLKTEFKRVAKRLPSLFIGAIVLTILVGAISCCALLSAQIRGEKEQVGAKVALVAPEDGITELAVSFVEGMESVQEWCSFERYSLEDGLQALKDKKVVAVIELPEDLIASILDGRNIPARLYLSDSENMGSILLEIMAQSGIRLLQVAQGEIYATSKLYGEYGFRESLGSLYSEINLYNLDFAINREQLFKTKMLSETGGLSIGAYYGATALSLMTLVFGLLFADFMLEHTRRDDLLHISRISYATQMFGRWKVLTLANFVWSLTVTIFLRVWLSSDEKVGSSVRGCLRESLWILLVIACVTAGYLALGNLIKDKMPYMFLIGIMIFVCGYAGGYFVPSGLLGRQMKALAEYLPTTHLHRIYSGALAGQKVDASLACLLLWLAAGLTIAILLRGRRGANEP